MQRREFLRRMGLGAAMLMVPGAASRAAGEKGKHPNILWICVEDMSAHIGCYGETTIQTPHIDRLAREGTRFTRAFITAPVCSPSRSAMVTGMYQTAIGAHNHRSSRHAVKIRLPEAIKLIPEYFQQAGYHTSNGGMLSKNPGKTKKGKTDYNFVFNAKDYDGTDWYGRQAGQPFFAQFQLHGGKARGAKVPNPVDPAKVTLPPYYPDHPALRADWARYLNSIIKTDLEVGEILDRLEKEGLLEETIVFFWTDHGISHVRDKQYLYEGGIHIPLIVRGPGIPRGAVREDLVEHIDIPATSLGRAGISSPGHLQGRDLFKTGQAFREYVFAARDRCDETVERLRCVRNKRFKYIRNYYPERPHAQPNRYKDGKEIMEVMRALYREGKLKDHQARPFVARRPREELYDLEADPYELTNLAESPYHQRIVRRMSEALDDWILKSRDLGEFPEPELAELYQRYPSAYAILEEGQNRTLMRRLIELRRLGRKKAVDELVMSLNDERSAARNVAATELGKIEGISAVIDKALEGVLEDAAETVRVAAAQALVMRGQGETARAVLMKELREAKNEVVRHYAALGLEDMGETARPALGVLRPARQDSYEYVKRVATRVVNKLGG